MLTFVLDASAYLRFVLQEAGHKRVQEILEEQKQGRSQAVMSAVQWGEVVKIVTMRQGPIAADSLLRYLKQIGFQIVAVTTERAQRAALIGLRLNISYADSFGVELTLDSPEHVLVTADYGAKPAEQEINIEFLPTKPKP